MKIFFKILIVLTIGVIIICGFSFFTDHSKFGQWKIQTNSNNTPQLSWIKFYWISDTLGKRHYEKTAIFIPAKIEELPYIFSFQLDLGSDLTMIYEITLQ